MTANATVRLADGKQTRIEEGDTLQLGIRHRYLILEIDNQNHGDNLALCHETTNRVSFLFIPHGQQVNATLCATRKG